jgi:3-oxoadipate enol-lactonase
MDRGTGRSSKPETPYTIELMADEAKAVLDAAGVEQAHVYGISMGGMIAQRLALNYPERIKTLILGCTSPGGTNQIQPGSDVIMTLLSGASIPTTPLEAALGISSHTLQYILHRKPSRFHCRAY